MRESGNSSTTATIWRMCKKLYSDMTEFAMIDERSMHVASDKVSQLMFNTLVAGSQLIRLGSDAIRSILVSSDVPADDPSDDSSEPQSTRFGNRSSR